uniref:Uncharacterized protein n=1 Tax=Arundo donax TaxID=35708 RepID=A0A0A9H3Z0_ARUDO
MKISCSSVNFLCILDVYHLHAYFSSFR